jgi:long-chain acyl-CoA synthetase
LSSIAERAEGSDTTARQGASPLATSLVDQMPRFAGATSLDSLSSLDRVELLSRLEQQYNLEINEEEFSEAKSAEDLRELLARSAARGAQEASVLSPRSRYPRWTQLGPVRWLRLLVYYLLVWPATQILAHPRVHGGEHLRGVTGPVIVVSNHITRRADIGLILAALPARFRHRLATAMGGETLLRMDKAPRNWFFLKRWVYQLGYWLVTLLFNVFPLPRFSGFRQSFRFAGESVDRGYSLLVFPEGEVNNSNDGRMAPFQSGIGLLAENLQLPIVPIRLDGVWQMKRERRRLAHFGEINVRIGKPVKFPDRTPPERMARELESIVRDL